MTIKKLYNGIITAKNGTIIPCVSNGRTIESRYNPENDAERLLQTINKEAETFIVMGGGSGLFVNALTHLNQCRKIFCVENTAEDLQFLASLPVIKELLSNKKVIFTNISKINECLLQNYLPVRDGNLQVIEQRAWIAENSEYIPFIKEQINNALDAVKSDFLTQAHFGKLWQDNILKNLKLHNRNTVFTVSSEDLQKEAVIIAAGPGLEQKLKLITENPDKYYLIATDTGLQVLLRNKIVPQIAVTLDGQSVSVNHFEYLPENFRKTVVFSDLTGNFSLNYKLCKQNINLQFYITNHPLSNFINKTSGNCFIKLNAGNGTVTSVSLDLAIKLGFKKIKVFGADFGYLNNKSYSKGTYFDTLYNLQSNLLNTTEKAYAGQIYSKKLEKIEEKLTTSLFTAYKTGFENQLSESGCSYTNDNNMYEIFCHKNLKPQKDFYSGGSTILPDIKAIPAQLKNQLLLPYCCYLRLQPSTSPLSLENLTNLAYQNFVRYN